MNKKQKEEFDQLASLGEQIINVKKSGDPVIDPARKESIREELMTLYKQKDKTESKTETKEETMNPLFKLLRQKAFLAAMPALCLAIVAMGLWYQRPEEEANEAPSAATEEQAKSDAAEYRMLGMEPEAEMPLASVFSLSGRAFVQELGSDEWVRIDSSSTFQIGNKIRTGNNGKLTLLLVGQNEVRLNSDTLIELRILETGTGDSGAIVGIDHTYGEAYHRVVVLGELHPSYKVTTPQIAIEAMGTAFDSDVNKDEEETTVTAIEHTIKVTKGNNSVELEQGKKLNASTDSDELNPEDVNKDELDNDWINENKEEDQEKGYEVGILEDTTPPEIIINSPVDGSTTDNPTTIIAGQTEAGSQAWVNGQELAIGDDGSFSLQVGLLEGENRLLVEVKDSHFNRAEKAVTIYYVKPESEPEPEPEPDPEPATGRDFTVSKVSKSEDPGQVAVKVSWTYEGYDDVDGFKIIAGKGYLPTYNEHYNYYAYYAGTEQRSGTILIKESGEYTIRVCGYNAGAGKCYEDIYSSNSLDYTLDVPAINYADSVSITKSQQSGENGVLLQWEISGGSAPNGFKIAISAPDGEAKPTYPIRPGDYWNYISSPEARSYTVTETDKGDSLIIGKTYHFRVCIYQGGSCSVYSQDVAVKIE